MYYLQVPAQGHKHFSSFAFCLLALWAGCRGTSNKQVLLNWSDLCIWMDRLKQLGTQRYHVNFLSYLSLWTKPDLKSVNNNSQRARQSRNLQQFDQQTNHKHNVLKMWFELQSGLIPALMLCDVCVSLFLKVFTCWKKELPFQSQ